MFYKLERESGAHLDLLSSTLKKWSDAEPDVVITSQERRKILAPR